MDGNHPKTKARIHAVQKRKTITRFTTGSDTGHPKYIFGIYEAARSGRGS